MKYRQDIDGLRAVAVFSVILYHLGIRGFNAGFLGVDIFFVISGYLITNIVFRDIESGGFSLKKFYERRALRIFPALFAMMAFCLVVGYFELLPHEFSQIGQSVIATTLFFSNFLFFGQSNYFSSAAAMKPMLHTWSLGVEEQFYILFPLLLILIVRKKHAATSGFIVLGLLACASLGLDVWLSRAHEEAAFYLPFPRAWELLCGALLALGGLPQAPNRLTREVVNVTGLALIGGSVLFLEMGGHPVIPDALWACLGAVLVIYAGQGGSSLSAIALGNPLARYFGKISYSLYIWHWPLIVFYRLLFKYEIRAPDKIILLVTILVVGALSERFIERPFRRPTPQPSPAKTHRALAVSAGAMAVFLAAAVTIDKADGFKARFPYSVVKTESYLQYGDMPFFRTDKCFLSTDSNDVRYFARDSCLSYDIDKKNILVFGDSHAADLWFGLSSANPSINFLQATVAGCAPVLGAQPPFAFSDACDAVKSLVFNDYLPRHKLDAVIISARWDNNAAREIGATVAYLRKFANRVFVVGPNIEYIEPLPRLLAISDLKRDPKSVSQAERPADAPLEAQLRDATRKAGGTYISLRETLCSSKRCAAVTPEGTPIDLDTDHFSADGSRFVAMQWRARGFPD